MLTPINLMLLKRMKTVRARTFLRRSNKRSQIWSTLLSRKKTKLWSWRLSNSKAKMVVIWQSLKLIDSVTTAPGSLNKKWLTITIKLRLVIIDLLKVLSVTSLPRVEFLNRQIIKGRCFLVIHLTKNKRRLVMRYFQIPIRQETQVWETFKTTK